MKFFLALYAVIALSPLSVFACETIPYPDTSNPSELLANDMWVADTYLKSNEVKEIIKDAEISGYYCNLDGAYSSRLANRLTIKAVCNSGVTLKIVSKESYDKECVNFKVRKVVFKFNESSRSVHIFSVSH
jgi:hypothetical protein